MAKERTGHSVESRKTKMINVVIFLLLATLAFFTVYPVIYILFGSFKTNNELVRGGVNLLPRNSFWTITSRHGKWRISQGTP